MAATDREKRKAGDGAVLVSLSPPRLATIKPYARRPYMVPQPQYLDSATCSLDHRLFASETWAECAAQVPVTYFTLFKQLRTP